MEKNFGWSWGGFLCPLLFCIRFSLWIPALLCFVPALNWILFIVLGFKGREMSWQAGTIPNVDEFFQTHQKWDKILTVVFFLSFIPVWLFVFFAVSVLFSL